MFHRDTFRVYYQNPVIEVVCVFGAATVHACAGLARIALRSQRTKRLVFVCFFGKKKKKKSKITRGVTSLIHPHRVLDTKKETDNGGEKGVAAIPVELVGHRRAGYALLAFFGVHVAATRLVPRMYGIHFEYSFVSAGLRDAPYLIYPLYIILGVSGFNHLLYGLNRALSNVFGFTLLPSNWRPGTARFAALTYVGVALVISTVVALGGNYFNVSINDEKWLEIQHDVLHRIQTKISPE
jgi:hypothetical protein